MKANGRSCLLSGVHAALEGNPGAILYGSFSNDTFHYDQATQHSLSDVDVVLPQSTPTRRLQMARRLQSEIHRLTGHQFYVSVRGARIHDHRIALHVAPIVGFFELLAKVDSLRTDDRREYFMAKFLLRALAPAQFFNHPNRGPSTDEMLLKATEYHKLMRIKLGLEKEQQLNWNSLIRRLPSPGIRRAAWDLWVVGETADAPHRLLREFRPVFTGNDSLYVDLHRKLSTVEGKAP